MGRGPPVTEIECTECGNVDTIPADTISADPTHHAVDLHTYVTQQQHRCLECAAMSWRLTGH